MDSRFEIIDAFVDGERVDAGALKQALSDPAGRDYLVDVWLLREGVHEQLASEPAAPSVLVRARTARPWLFAAALIACVVGGYFAGYRVSGGLGRPAPAAPPPAANIPATPVRTASPLQVPVPTRVIQVQFGAEASTSGGGD